MLDLKLGPAALHRPDRYYVSVTSSSIEHCPLCHAHILTRLAWLCACAHWSQTFRLPQQETCNCLTLFMLPPAHHELSAGLAATVG